jgi:hypothetical protein
MVTDETAWAQALAYYFVRASSVRVHQRSRERETRMRPARRPRAASRGAARAAAPRRGRPSHCMCLSRPVFRRAERGRVSGWRVVRRARRRRRSAARRSSDRWDRAGRQAQRTTRFLAPGLRGHRRRWWWWRRRRGGVHRHTSVVSIRCRNRVDKRQRAHQHAELVRRVHRPGVLFQVTSRLFARSWVESNSSRYPVLI